MIGIAYVLVWCSGVDLGDSVTTAGCQTISLPPSAVLLDHKMGMVLCFEQSSVAYLTGLTLCKFGVRVLLAIV